MTLNTGLTDAVPLLLLLKQYFGFTAFRPMQHDIIRDALAGRDVFALLPTGGGKSLCFQLPALVRPGLTVVVSPLIALMKDQVDAMGAAGIAATYLNSSLTADESRARLRGLHGDAYRVLYLAPERLMLSGVLDDLRRWNVTLIAVDEAHCISEWGHDFRPEYRRLAELREHFPRVPVMALTATATERVRCDIVQHLRLREPRCYVGSLNRPNLTYRIVAKSKPYEQVRQFVRQHSLNSGIVYCQSRKSAESVAERLQSDGVEARAYHAGLSPEVRARNQDLFLRDHVRVICATVAFGMGINKPNVRYVIHYDVPKNLEGYYQETGRAGRDGLPSDCLLLFGAGDVIKYSQFIAEKPDPREQQLAREQLRQMVAYAESTECRRRDLLRYFGEAWEAHNCGACDNCLSPRLTFDGTTVAQTFLACVADVQRRNGCGMGMTHVIEVLTGAATEKIRVRRHDELATYGTGTQHSRAEWAAIGRELVHLGYLRQTTDRFSVLEMTDEGRAALTQPTRVMLSTPAVPGKPAESVTGRSGLASQASGDGSDSEALFERLRRLRKKLADERDVPAYIIFSDVSLRHMAKDRPASEQAFARISGVGEKKLREFSAVFLAEISMGA